MTNKINLALIFGGQSPEHQVSLLSAKTVLSSLDRSQYTLLLIGIDEEGKWHRMSEEVPFSNEDDPTAIALGEKCERLHLAFGEETPTFFSSSSSYPVDVAFPILHGSHGEEGSIQGLFTLANLPYVGADILGSAIGMDKEVMKRLLRDAQIPIAPFLSFTAKTAHHYPFEKIAKSLTPPYFVKPANTGSSIGITYVASPETYTEAIRLALTYDKKVLIEQAIEGREIECSLLGNEQPIVSIPCEIIPREKLQSYSSKYLDKSASQQILPAPLTPEELTAVQTTAIKAYQTLCCRGMARVDLFLTNAGEVVINEINTIPGMTEMSPFLPMWEASGVSKREVFDRLIRLSIPNREEVCV